MDDSTGEYIGKLESALLDLGEASCFENTEAMVCQTFVSYQRAEEIEALLDKLEQEAKANRDDNGWG